MTAASARNFAWAQPSARRLRISGSFSKRGGQLEAAKEDLLLQDGKIMVRGSAGKSVSMSTPFAYQGEQSFGSWSFCFRLGT
jgi:hypothetical protein